jgi:dTDP-3-amino-3,4,6-trideoxy-alpha-D-glucose transaminase
MIASGLPSPRSAAEGPQPAGPWRVPFLDLGAVNDEVRDAIDSAIDRVRTAGRYILAEEVEAFEAEWAARVGAAGCVGVGNGLDALTLALRAIGVEAGDEVIVPGFTFVATWLSVTACGARVVPVDVDPATANLDPALLEAAITTRTRAIVAVHLYGRMAPMQAIVEIARRHGLPVLEDAAQAHGARLDGRSAGAIGDATAWSFYPSKNLGALGDGGAVTSDDPGILDAVRRLRNYGSAVRYVHEIVGVNSRLDELQAAVLRAKLPYLAGWNGRRRAVAGRYGRLLAGLPDLTLPPPALPEAHVFHLCVVRYPRRDLLARVLAESGVQTLIHYPIPPHLQPAYAGTGLELARLPQSEAWAAEALSLPIAHVTDEQVELVAAAVVRAIDQIDRIGNASHTSRRTHA